MPCYRPLKGYRSKTVSSNGKRAIVFSHNEGYIDMPVQVPCGQCIGCRLERSRQWAIRCMHEASLYEDNAFITLTYADEYLPQDLSVNVREFQLFMKRVRKKYSGRKIRFYHCGEYGETYGRPHYHAILFNLDFSDKVLHQEKNGNRLYTSQTLEELWPYGYSTIGDVTFQSAAYVARYIMKKVTGEQAADHYEYVDEYGEIHQRAPEYTTMSRRPGIGKRWLEKFSSEVYPFDRVVVNGKEVKPPKYYDRQFELETPSKYSKIRSQRIVKAKQHKENNTKDRLRVREKVQQARLAMLPRTLDKDD